MKAMKVTFLLLMDQSGNLNQRRQDNPPGGLESDVDPGQITNDKIAPGANISKEKVQGSTWEENFQLMVG